MKTSGFASIFFIMMMLPPIGYGQLQTTAGSNQGFADFWKSHVKARMVSQMYTAYAFDDHQFQMVRFALKPEIRVKLNKNLRFTGIGRFYGEALDRLEPGRPDQSATSAFSRKFLIGDRFEAELREFYVDWYVGKHSNLRFGKQQVVWGQTDGLKLLDVVNPQNFREFILEEFEDSRIPLWSIKAEFPVKGLDIEMVWIPDLSYHIFPAQNAPYFPRATIPQPPQGAAVNMRATDKPDRLIADSDFGVKVSAFTGGWDLTLNYFYHYDDFPVFTRHVISGMGEKPSITIQPQYKRMHTLGGTFNNTFGPITLRGELALHFGRQFTTGSLSDTDGIVRSDQLLFAVGVDWPINETMLSIQFFNDLLISNVPVYHRKKYDPSISFLVSQELLNDDVKLQVMMVQSLQYGGGMIRPQVSYMIRSNVKLVLGSDLFYGNSNGIFGEFRDRSRLFIGVEWGI